jgi:hypothetical protein
MPDGILRDQRRLAGLQPTGRVHFHSAPEIKGVMARPAPPAGLYSLRSPSPADSEQEGNYLSSLIIRQPPPDPSLRQCYLTLSLDASLELGYVSRITDSCVGVLRQELPRADIAHGAARAWRQDNRSTKFQSLRELLGAMRRLTITAASASEARFKFRASNSGSEAGLFRSWAFLLRGC